MCMLKKPLKIVHAVAKLTNKFKSCLVALQRVDLKKNQLLKEVAYTSAVCHVGSFRQKLTQSARLCCMIATKCIKILFINII